MLPRLPADAHAPAPAPALELEVKLSSELPGDEGSGAAPPSRATAARFMLTALRLRASRNMTRAIALVLRLRAGDVGIHISAG